MYLDFFQLTKEPFHVTPDPEFLYLSESHRQALAAIVYGVKKRKGLITITGPVGSGKTTILRTFLKNSEATRFKVIYIFDPAVPFSTLVARLCEEFGIQDARDDVPRAVEKLYLSLADHYRKGSTVVLIVDEAQNMPVETLERMRMLSNFETTEDKLMQIVLCGQPELEELFRNPTLRSLKQRRAIRATILPLKKKEAEAYIKHRLSRAGAVDTALFGRRAMNTLVREAGGIPRTLNILCDNALATSYAYGKRRIDTHTAREVVRDMQERKPHRHKAAVAAAAAAVVVLLALGAIGLRFVLPSFLDRFVAGEQVAVNETKAPPHRFSLPSSETETPAPIREKPNESRHRRPATTVVVKKGDTISGLIRDIYHVREARQTSSLVGEVMKTNPDIKSARLIFEGQKLVFPDVKSGSLEASK
jgi:general secretion pathway protein A